MHQPSVALSHIQVISNHGFAEIRINIKSNQKSLHAVSGFNNGEVISVFSAGEVCSSPHYLTVQTGKERHITLVPQFLQYINHSCDPNVFFDTASMQLKALKNISVNEEFSFFYPSTEWDMAQPFYCYCESQNCLQNIQGARYLNADQIKRYRFTDFIMNELHNIPVKQ